MTIAVGDDSYRISQCEKLRRPVAEPGPIDSLRKPTYHSSLPTLLVQVALDVPWSGSSVGRALD